MILWKNCFDVSSSNFDDKNDDVQHNCDHIDVEDSL